MGRKHAKPDVATRQSYEVIEPGTELLLLMPEFAIIFVDFMFFLQDYVYVLAGS